MRFASMSVEIQYAVEGFKSTTELRMGADESRLLSH